jgi:hypothetical protein
MKGRGWRLAYTSCIQIDLTDGKSHRREASVNRDDPAYRIDVIMDVVRTVAPQVPFEDSWEMPEEEV